MPKQRRLYSPRPPAVKVNGPVSELKNSLAVLIRRIVSVFVFPVAWTIENQTSWDLFPKNRVYDVVDAGEWAAVASAIVLF